MKNHNTTFLLLFAFLILITSMTVFRLDLTNEVGRLALITGAATSGTGQVNITAVTNVAVTLSGDVNFGSGYVNESNNTANVTSETAYTSATAWINTTAAWIVNTNITINNTGDTFVNITVAANQSVSSWLGGTSPDARLKFVDNEAGSCTGSYPANYSIQPNATTQNVCTSTILGQGMDYTQSSDTIATYVMMLLPKNMAKGTRSTTLTFTATANQ